VQNVSRRSGSVLVIVLLLVVVLAALYFISDPFRTKVDESTRQATTWTPENIQKNPVGYLQFSLSELAAISSKLEARVLALNTQKNQADRQAGKADAEAGQLKLLVEQAKALYLQASKDGTWPVALNGHSVSEDQLKEKIVNAHQRAESLSARVQAYTQTTAKLDRALKDLFQKQKEVAGLQQKLQSDLEMVKINQSVKDIEHIEDSVAAIMATSQALVGADAGSLPELDVLLDAPETSKIDAAFQDIMK